MDKRKKGILDRIVSFSEEFPEPFQGMVCMLGSMLMLAIALPAFPFVFVWVCGKKLDKFLVRIDRM